MKDNVTSGLLQASLMAMRGSNPLRDAVKEDLQKAGETSKMRGIVG